MFKKNAFAFAFLLALASSAFGLTYGEADALVRERSSAIKASAAEVLHRAKAYEASKSLSGPKVTASITEVQGRKDFSFTYNLAMLPLPIHVEKEFDISGPRAVLEAYWPLFTGGAISAQQAALKAKAEAGEALHLENVDRQRLELVKLYFGLALAERVRHLREEIVRQTESDYARAQKFEKAGMTTHLETLNALVTLDTARRALAQAATDASIARSNLSSFLHEKAVGKLATALTVAKTIPGESHWVGRALAANPLLMQAAAGERQAANAVKAARAAYSPQVFLYGKYNAIRHYLSITEPDWVAGLGVSFTLWDNRDRSASLYSAMALSEKASFAGEEARRVVTDATVTAYMKTLQAKDTYALAASTVSLARENLRLATKAHAEGLLRIDDVNTARNKYIEASLGRDVAAYGFVISYAMLHAASASMDGFAEDLLK